MMMMMITRVFTTQYLYLCNDCLHVCPPPPCLNALLVHQMCILPRLSHSSRESLPLFFTLPMNSGGIGSMCWSKLSGGEAAAFAAPSQWSFSPFRCSWASSSRKTSRSSSHSSGQNCRTCACPALSKPCFICSKQGILRLSPKQF